MTGLVPDWVTILAKQKRNLPSLTTLVVLLIVIAASIVFVHPQVAELWTGEVPRVLLLRAL